MPVFFGAGRGRRTFVKVLSLANKEVKQSDKPICANVDCYSGLVYRALGIPDDLFTPIFAVSRIAGWCAHRIEELMSGSRIIRPAYRAVQPRTPYVNLQER